MGVCHVFGAQVQSVPHDSANVCQLCSLSRSPLFSSFRGLLLRQVSRIPVHPSYAQV